MVEILHFRVALHFPEPGVPDEIQYEGTDEQLAIRALHSTIPVIEAGEELRFIVRGYGA